MSENFESIIKRCLQHEIMFKPIVVAKDVFNESSELNAIEIKIPEERSFRSLIIYDNKSVDTITKSKFEKFKFIKSYEAIWSEELGIVECELQTSALVFSNVMLKNRLNFIFGNADSDRAPDRYEFPCDDRWGIKVTLGLCSLDFNVLSSLKNQNSPIRVSFHNKNTLRIEGATFKSHDDAKKLLLKLSNSILFQIDLATDVPFQLVLDRNITRNIRGQRLAKANMQLQPPKFEYDNDALSLYWYARFARDMPLLQYLAFYQILEYYFPTYSHVDAQKLIKNLLKDPTFDVNKDHNIAQVLNIIKVSSKGKSYGDEKSQLKATILNCVNIYELWDFFTENDERKEFFDVQSKKKGLVKHKIPFANKENDIRIDTANRIYEMRCRIVHTKDEDELDLILPTSPEITLIKYDLELIEFISRRVLIAGGRQLII